jgi:hypothetical protein
MSIVTLRAGYVAIALLISAGLLSTPVECALAAGPHSLYHAPKSSTETKHDGHHHMANHAEEATEDAGSLIAASPSAQALLTTLTNYALSQPECHDPRQNSLAPVSPLAGLSSSGEGSAPVSVTNREARVPGTAVLDSEAGRMLSRTSTVAEPVTSAAAGPDTPPPE